MTGGSRLPRFNFETMSGVYPGTRTQLFQRIALKKLIAENFNAESGKGAEGAKKSKETAESVRLVGGVEGWALVYWYENPSSCVVRLEGAPVADAVSLAEPLAAEGSVLVARLENMLAEQAWRPFICGNCASWQAGVGSTSDGLPLGECRLRRAQASAGAHAATESSAADSAGSVAETGVALPLLLSAQSALAMGCHYWTQRGEGGEDRAEAALPLLPLPKIAETSESKMKPLRRMRAQFARWINPPKLEPTLSDWLVERSGVGAGTEACPCCQGRIANLGALAVANDEGDKQTLSVWRCRVCHALFLSDWIDRWERVDSLETEETLYRLSPIEAAEMLTLIAGVSEAEHPRRRGERAAEREWFLQQIAGRTPVIHVIKQGR